MIDGLTFNPEKPFFPLVLNYLCALHGHLELTSRNFTAEIGKFAKSPADLESFAQKIDSKIMRERLPEIAKGHTTVLWEDLGLFSKIESRHLTLETQNLAKSITLDHQKALPHFSGQSGGALLILAWNTTEVFHTHEPIWEFLRHCRNAAAHRGSFTFSQAEPRRPAVWRNISITKSLEGRSLLPGTIQDALLGPGDILLLLHDLETHIH